MKSLILLLLVVLTLQSNNTTSSETTYLYTIKQSYKDSILFLSDQMDSVEITTYSGNSTPILLTRYSPNEYGSKR